MFCSVPGGAELEGKAKEEEKQDKDQEAVVGRRTCAALQGQQKDWFVFGGGVQCM